MLGKISGNLNKTWLVYQRLNSLQYRLIDKLRSQNQRHLHSEPPQYSHVLTLTFKSRLKRVQYWHGITSWLHLAHAQTCILWANIEPQFQWQALHASLFQISIYIEWTQRFGMGSYGNLPFPSPTNHETFCTSCRWRHRLLTVRVSRFYHLHTIHVPKCMNRSWASNAYQPLWTNTELILTIVYLVIDPDSQRFKPSFSSYPLRMQDNMF